MFKKIELWIVLLLLVLFFIFLIFFGAVLRSHYNDIDRFNHFKKIFVFLADIPSRANQIYQKNTLNLNFPSEFPRHSNKEKVNIYKNYNRDTLLILSRYNADIKRSIVEIIDPKNFNVLHTYNHDITFMNSLIDTNSEEHKLAEHSWPEIRFEYNHPLVTDNGDLISIGSEILFKTDFCSNLIWINQEDQYHHSISLDADENLWVGNYIYPYSKYVDKVYRNYAKKFFDDGIAKIDQDGKILFRKSIAEILIENKLAGAELFFEKKLDPIHANDIQPAFSDTQYWKKNDLFISARSLDAIIHYRPSNNKVINYITGPFFSQHDVDFISDKEISIFNNNNSLMEDSKYSEVLIYNFETKKFSKKFDKNLKKINFKTSSEGQSEILSDGSLYVEEQNDGRIIFFDGEGDKIWEYINIDKNGKVYYMKSSRILEDTNIIKKLRNKISTTKCKN